MRVVLDTNILISACWRRDGLEAEVLAHALHGSFISLATQSTWAEYNEVLRRPKFARVEPEVNRLLAQLEKLLVWVEATESSAAAKDEDDNRFLECAIAGKADYLVTGNLRDFPAEHGEIKIRHARHFLNDAQFNFAGSAEP